MRPVRLNPAAPKPKAAQHAALRTVACLASVLLARAAERPEPTHQRPFRLNTTLTGLTAEPALFSPAFSPLKLDRCRINFTLSREMPVSLLFFQNGVAVREIPASELKTHAGEGLRFEWNGTDSEGRALPDGPVRIEAWTTVSNLWRVARRDGGRAPATGEPVSIAPTAAGCVIAENRTGRLVFMDPDGVLTRTIATAPLLPRFAPGMTPALAADPTGRSLYLLGGRSVVVLDEQGAVRRRMELAESPVIDSDEHAPGLYITRDGNLLVSNGLQPLSRGRAPLLGGLACRLRLFSADGRLLHTLDPPPHGAFAGPLLAATGARAEHVYAQLLLWEPGKQARVDAVVIRINGAEAPLAINATTLRMPWPDISSLSSDVFASGPLFFHSGRGGVAAYDRAGRYLWTLGSAWREPFAPAAAFAQGDSLICAHRGAEGYVDRWRIGPPALAGSVEVTIDNTPPDAAPALPEGFVNCGEARFELHGHATDLHFERYRVSMRPLPSAPGTRRLSAWFPIGTNGLTGWSQPLDFTVPVSNGVLAAWSVPVALRNTGIEVFVEAWDRAGNATTSAATPFSFDDDGDGMSNPFELAQGTDPNAATEQAPTNSVRIRPELAALVRPYFFNQADHSLRIYVDDLRAPSQPVELTNALLHVRATAGSIARQPPDAAVPVRSGAPFTWHAPDVDAALVTFHVTFPQQGLNNILYPAAEQSFEVPVRRDEDRDWAPDDTEAEPGSDPPGAQGDRGCADTDGDGVPDGIDLAPRTAYADAWSHTYATGMVYYTQPFRFYGIGGGESKVIKYGAHLKGKNILRSDRVRSPASVASYLNDAVFGRNEANPRKRKPFAVVGWRDFAPTAAGNEDFLRKITYGGTGYVDYEYQYYSLSSSGTAMIENVDPIDGRRNPGGVHRNYLWVAVPGARDEFDRTVTIQWRMTGRDLSQTKADGSSVAPGWIVEALPGSPDLKGADLSFSSFGAGEKTTGQTYETAVQIPGRALFRNVPLYFKLTPCWLTRRGGPTACPVCRAAGGAAEDACAACGAALGRYDFGPLDQNQLTVAAVVVETEDGAIQWFMNAAPDGDETLDQLERAVAGILAGERLAWPPQDTALERTVAGNGFSRRVLVCSAAGINRYPRQLTPAGREARLRELSAFTRNHLAGTDAVCLAANTKNELTDLINRIWGGAGMTGPGGDTTPPPAGSVTHDPAQGPGIPDGDAPLTAELAAWGTFGQATYKIYREFARAAKLQSIRAIENEGAWNLLDTFTGQSRPDPVTGLRLEASRVLAVQKCRTGGYYFESRAIVRRPWTEWADAATGKAVRDRGCSQEFFLIRTERVADPAQSKLLERGCEVPGTTAFTRTQWLDWMKPRAQVGVFIVGYGLKFYECTERGDKLGMLVFTLSGTAQALQVVAEAKKAEGVLVNGLRVTKLPGAKFNPLAAAAGVMESLYYLYRAEEAPNVIARTLAEEQAFGAAIDAGIGALEPYGGFVLAGWTVGGMLGNKIADAAGMGNSPLARQVASSPGQALIFLPLNVLPLSVPAAFNDEAARLAQEAAIEIVNSRNADPGRTRTYLFIPPEQ